MDRPLVCLLDACTTRVIIQDRILPPPGVVPNISLEKRIDTTVDGSFDMSRSVKLKNMQLPEFVNGGVLGGVEARMFHSLKCRYDIIFGFDFLRDAQIKCCFHTNSTANWLGVKLDRKLVDPYVINNASIDIEMQPYHFYKEILLAMC